MNITRRRFLQGAVATACTAAMPTLTLATEPDDVPGVVYMFASAERYSIVMQKLYQWCDHSSRLANYHTHYGESKPSDWRRDEAKMYMSPYIDDSGRFWVKVPLVENPYQPQSIHRPWGPAFLPYTADLVFNVETGSLLKYRAGDLRNFPAHSQVARGLIPEFVLTAPIAEVQYV